MSTQEKKRALNELALGDHLERYLDYSGPEWFLHHGVITEIKNHSLDDIRVIHFHGKDSSDAVVKKSTLGQFLSEHKVFWRRNYTCDDVLPVEDTLAILNAAVGLRYYNLMVNNCEHLCLTAKLGENVHKYEDQVNIVKCVMGFLTGIYALYNRDELSARLSEALLTIKEIAWKYSKFAVVSGGYTLYEESNS
jgi:hypothetical protein